MKWIKWLLITLILALVALFVIENLPVFDSPTTFILDLHFREYQWSLKFYTVIGIGALLGFILGVLVMLKPHMKVRRTLSEERQAKERLQEKPPAQEAAPQPSASSPAAAADSSDSGAPTSPDS